MLCIDKLRANSVEFNSMDLIKLHCNYANYRRLNMEDADQLFRVDIEILIMLLPEFTYIGIFEKKAIFVLRAGINEIN